MTIAVGFWCMDGLMLCADTQETRSSYMKKKQPKIEVRGATPGIFGKTSGLHTPSPCAVFAGASEDGDLTDMLVDKLWAAMEPKGKDGLDAMIEAAEDELIKQYQRLVPTFPFGIVPDSMFLIGVWAAPWKFELLKVHGPVLKRNVMIESIGIGDILATYITGRLVYPKTWISLSMPIGLYVIDQVKLFVEGCGGDTQAFLVSGVNGSVEYLTSEDSQAESERIREIDWSARQMVGLTMQSFNSMDQFDVLVRDEIERLRKLVKIEPMSSDSESSEDRQ